MATEREYQNLYDRIAALWTTVGGSSCGLAQGQQRPGTFAATADCGAAPATYNQQFLVQGLRHCAKKFMDLRDAFQAFANPNAEKAEKAEKEIGRASCRERRAG